MSASSSPTRTKIISARWPSCGRRLGVPVYMTRFAAGLAEARRLGRARRAQDPDPDRRARRARRRSARSTSSSSRSPIRSPRAARWRSARRPASSSTPATGRSIRRRWSAARPTRRASRRSATRACSALVCDSTNVLREGESPSEARRRRDASPTLVAKAKGRVVVTTFASNVARLRAAAEAGFRRRAAGAAFSGRAMERVVAVARECGYLDGVPQFLGMDAFERLPRDKMLALATGSQGEPRAALARIVGGRASDRGAQRRATPSSSPRAPFPATRRRSARSSTRFVAAGRRGHHRPQRARPCLRPSAPRRTCAKCTPG